MRPIFVHGLMQRTGTNYLADLLDLHPEVEKASPIWEAYFLDDSDDLEDYARALARHWPERWGVPAPMEKTIARALGSGLLELIAPRTEGRRPLAKTPSVKNVGRFFDFFPDAFLIVLVRDGRDVVESGHRSFGWDREVAAFQWADAADTVLDFLGGPGKDHPSVRLVRFEDLFESPARELKALLDFLHLPLEGFDFEAATRLGVRGSSETKADGGRVHWTPMERPRNFKPVARWQAWSDAEHARFSWIAGRQSRALGYDVPVEPLGITDRLRHATMDLRAAGRYLGRAMTTRIRSGKNRR